MNFVILAGGLGTRLQSVVKDVPKPMAPIGGVPFLELLIREILFCDPERIVLCVSYLKDTIKAHFGDNFLGVPVLYSEEEQPLGTGGAIKRAFDAFGLEEAVVLNGDTYVRVDYQNFINSTAGEKLAVVLKRVDNANRYGRVEVEGGRITAFREKSSEAAAGLINAGIYRVGRELFSPALPEKFSFEKDLLEPRIAALKPKFVLAEDYFIDIGVPESYAQACAELKPMILGKATNKALFLDRDGVINVDKHHLHRVGDCEFMGGIFELCRGYKARGFKIVVVTNQAGIGKGLYSEEDYFKLRGYIHSEFEKQNCPIDAEYYCPFHPEGVGRFARASFYRKPNAGMILKAAKDLDIDLDGSVLIGDSETDITAAKRAGVGKTIRLINENNMRGSKETSADEICVFRGKIES